MIEFYNYTHIIVDNLFYPHIHVIFLSYQASRN